MRIPLAGNISTKDGAANKNSRLYNVLAETRKDGKVVAGIRPGLNRLASPSGNGNGVVCFGGDLISVDGVALNKLIGAYGWSTSAWGGNSAYKIIYAQNQYLMLCGGLYAYVSSDGDTWDQVTMPDYGAFRVAYGGGVYVALFSTGSPNTYAATSSDGLIWSATTLATSLTWASIAYGGGVFVAVSQSTNKANYSADGSSWAEATLPATDSWLCVAHNGTVFCAVPGTGSACAVSSDGVNWSSGTMPSGGWRHIASNGSIFVAINSTSNKSAYSSDGINWTSGGTLPASSSWEDLIWDGSKFVAVGGYSAKTGAYSSNGVSWSSLGMTGTEYVYAVGANGSGDLVAEGYVMVGMTPTQKLHRYAFSYSLDEVGTLSADQSYDFALIP